MFIYRLYIQHFTEYEWLSILLALHGTNKNETENFILNHIATYIYSFIIYTMNFGAYA